jgi:invasion protein IalB
MSRLCLFLLTLVLSGVFGPQHKGVAKQHNAVVDLRRKAIPSPANPRSVAQPATAIPAERLPNGASSITEIYGDWGVDCRLVHGQKRCLLLYFQADTQTMRRVFEIKLRTPSDGRLAGMILMPFGLKLDSGVVLKLDDKDLGEGLRFLTCVPLGCLLPVSFPTAAVNAMKTAKALTVASLNLSGGELVTFTVSLDGLLRRLPASSSLADRFDAQQNSYRKLSCPRATIRPLLRWHRRSEVRRPVYLRKPPTCFNARVGSLRPLPGVATAASRAGPRCDVPRDECARIVPAGLVRVDQALRPSLFKVIAANSRPPSSALDALPPLRKNCSKDRRAGQDPTRLAACDWNCPRQSAVV